MDINKQAIKKQVISLTEKFKKFCEKQRKDSDQRLLTRYNDVVKEIRTVNRSESPSNVITLVTLDRERDSLERKIKKRGLPLPPQPQQQQL